MKIVYAVPRYLPHLGGIENHVAALATGAARRGHDVTVLTQQEGAPAPVRETVDGVTIRRFPSLLPIRGQGLSPRLWQAVHRLDARTDVLHIHNVHAASTLGVLSAARPGPIVVTPHYLGSGAGTLNRTLHRLYDPSLARKMGKADAIVCVSRSEADELVRDLGLADDVIQVIPNGVDEVALATAEPADVTYAADAADAVRGAKGVILVAGRLERYKQPDLAIRALPYLPASYSVVIAGAGPEDRSLLALADTLDVAGRVRFLGKLPSAELARWYRRASVVVSMSTRECFGMTLAEGLAARCAVVASNIPAHREVVEAAGWDPATLIAPSSSGRELADTIVYAAASLEGFEPAVWTWDDVVETTLRIYEKACR